jgi:hypothetical protein
MRIKLKYDPIYGRAILDINNVLVATLGKCRVSVAGREFDLEAEPSAYLHELKPHTEKMLSSHITNLPNWMEIEGD